MATTKAVIAGPEAEGRTTWEGPSRGHQRDLVDFAYRSPMAGYARALWSLGHGSQSFLPVAEARIVEPASG